MTVAEQFTFRTAERRCRPWQARIDFPVADSIELPLLVIVSGSGPQDRDGYFGDSGTEDDLVYRADFAGGRGSRVRSTPLGLPGASNATEMTMPPLRRSEHRIGTRRKQYCRMCLDIEVRKE